MKETEFRIGNIINYEGDTFSIAGIKQMFDDEPYDVEIKGADGMFSEVGIEEIEPIPLTEEWLKRFALRKMDQRLFTEEASIREYGYAKPDGENNLLQFCVYKNVGGNFKTLGSFDEFQFVHQLQNLYFALTQKELEIK